MAFAPHASLAVVMKNQDAFTQSSLPISLLKSGQFLFIDPECKGGLILQKSFYADFVGPGAAVGSSFDTNCTLIYQLGVVNFRVPNQFAERQQAFQNRIHYSHQLAEIIEVSAPIQRASRVLEQLCAWVGVVETRKIPLELVAQLAGVLPKTVQLAWQARAGQRPPVMPQPRAVPLR